MRFIKSKRKLYLACIDIGIMLFVYLLCAAATFLADDLSLKGVFYLVNFAIFGAVIMLTRVFFGVYGSVWRYANSKMYIAIVASDIAGGVVAFFVTALLGRNLFYIGMWASIAFVAMTDVATLSSRFCYQVLYRHLKRDAATAGKRKANVAIVGAGQVGTSLAEELLYSANSRYTPVCFVDNSVDKVGSRIHGIEVINEADIFARLPALLVEEIIIALPKLSAERTRTLHAHYARTGCKVKIYDFPIKDFEDGEGEKRVLREIKIEDLLFRDALKVYDSDTRSFYADKVVLVTGGGGSIGSELCRQIAACAPKKLIILDIYENNAYEIQQELIRKYKGELDLAVEIGSVRDVAKLDAVFAHYRPEIVLHAAAHKHVPLMEHSSAEAIKNNVLGTYNAANAAEKYGVKKFILISTDKAVNPTNVMGASKRMCEMVIQCRTDSATAFAAVRFGNVLGSNGSVIPLFKRQIEAGGPITITDKRIIRYFMTIPEASGLVMQAGAMAKGGDLFVLDMGKPVKILDLAENMVRLSGLTPYTDIAIIETGLRPGEKLYEELLIKTESLDKTENDMIFIERDTPYTRDEVEDKLSLLRQAVRDSEDCVSSPLIKEALKSVVPTFREPEELNKTASDSREMKLAGVN